MPSGERRSARASRLMRYFQAAKNAAKKSLRRRKGRLRHIFRHARQEEHGQRQDDLSSISSMSDIMSFTFSESESASLNSSADSFMDTDNTSFTSISDGEESDDDEPMPELAAVYDSESEDEDEEMESDGVSDLLDFDADDELEETDSEDEEHTSLPGGKWQRLRKWVTNEIIGMYRTRYEESRDPLPRGPSYLHHVLMCLKIERADHFRENLRVSPATFDALVSAIEMDPVFANNSQNPQMPVEEQLAITLYRFGHDGNAASLQSVANWAGIGKGTVSVVTRRVMTAIL